MVVDWRKERRPLAVQVRDQIWNMLKDEKYLPGDRLPSEMSLVGRFGISRSALREALKILEEERVIFCQHGVGRFVAPDPSGVLQEDITHLKSVSELAQSLGMKFTCKVLSVQEQPVDAQPAVYLNLRPGTALVVLERVWCGPESPLIYSVDHFARALIPEALDPSLFEGSLLTLIEHSGQYRLAYSKTTLRAVHLEPEVIQRIQSCDTCPWILLEQVNYDMHGAPLLYSRDYYCSEKFQFSVLRRRR